MKLCKYTLKIEDETGTILYNLITKMNLKLPIKFSEDNIIEYILNNLSNEEINILKEKLIIVEDNYDDFKEFLKIKNIYNNQKEIGRFLIHTNYDCNLKCSYCYQSCIDKIKKMTDSKMNEIINFIKKATLQNSYKRLDICFIGGEPLLKYSKILYISKELNKIKNVEISYSIVTNGTIYSEKIFNLFIENNITNLQITIDGYKENHDELRVYKNNLGSYDKIISNLLKLQIKFPQIFVNLNCNISKKNQEKIEKMLIDLKNNGIKFPVHFSLVFDINGNDKLETEDKKIWYKVHKLAMKYGYKYEPFYREMYLGCAMTQKNYHIISVNGELYKCINAVENNDYYLSNINEYGSLNYEKKILKFLNYFPDYSICRECELLPICYGGCPFKNKNKNFSCDKELYYLNDIELIKELYRGDYD